MNIAVINQGGGRYLFEVPDGISLKKGETVKCDTVRGITDGIVWADSLIADEPTAQLIGKLTGAKFPLKSVVGKMEYSEFAKPAPDKPALKVGDRVTASDNAHLCTNEVGTIECVDPSDSSQKYRVNFDKGYAFWCYTDSVKPYIEDKPKYKSGDKVRVIANTCFHNFKEGDIITLTEPNAAGNTTCGNRVFAWSVAGAGCFIRECDIEPYTEPEYYNGKVVCVESSDDSFTVGKVYNWTDGVAKDNDGTLRPYNEEITSLDDSYMKNWSYKFIPFKGE